MLNIFFRKQPSTEILAVETAPADEVFRSIEEQVSLLIVPSQKALGRAASKRVQDLKASIRQCDRDLENLYERLPLVRAQVDAAADTFLSNLESESPPPNDQN